MTKRDFAGHHALVTGAASGIGHATALDLARRGARLSLVDIDEPGVAQTRASVEQLGATASAHVVDIASTSAIDALAAAVGPVDVLVSNAGVAVVKPFTETTSSDWSWIAGVNLWGPLHLARAFLPGMIERRRGRLAFVASLAGLVGAPSMVAYTTTKFAIVGFAEALRHELHGSGVSVTVLCPGYVRTGLHRATRYANDGFQRFLEHAPAYYGLSREVVARALVDAIEARQPLLVLGPEKVGWWLKRLAPEAAYAFSHWIARRTGTLT